MLSSRRQRGGVRRGRNGGDEGAEVVVVPERAGELIDAPDGADDVTSLVGQEL